MTTANVQKRFDLLYADVKEFYISSSTGNLSMSSVTSLTRYAMELVQTGNNWEGMKGSEKKNLVYGVITEVIKDLLNDPQVVGENFSDTTRQSILAALDLVPMIIDAAVDFAKTYASAQPVAAVDGQQPVARRRCFSFC